MCGFNTKTPERREPIIQAVEDSPAPILKLKDGTDTEGPTTLAAEDVKQDTGSSSMGGTNDQYSSLSIPTSRTRKKTAVAA